MVDKVTSPSLDTFGNYGYLESVLSAIKLDSTSQSKIITALQCEIEADKLAMLKIDTNATAGHYEFTFRYKTDTVDSILTSGNYLVKLNGGNYVVRDATTFEAEYLPTYMDTDLLPTTSQSVQEAVFNFMAKRHPSEFITLEDLTKENLTKHIDDYEPYFDSKTNTFTVKFGDCALVDPTGLSKVVSIFPEAGFIRSDTSFTLDFGNTGTPKDCQNLFNASALLTLVDEIRRLNYDFASRITKINFAPSDPSKMASSVAPSVDSMEWNEIVTSLIAVTGVINRSDIKK